MEMSGRDANEAATIKEGRDFFNEEPKAGTTSRTSILIRFKKDWER